MNLSSLRNGELILNGTCPHCGKEAAFPSVTSIFEDRQMDPNNRMVAAVACIACNGYMLAIIKYALNNNSWDWVYDIHYPLAAINDTVDDSVPIGVRLDFQEALRCRGANAYNATIEMCRRALEASCIQLGANRDSVLNDMIKWVHGQGKITTPLSDMAHKIKLGGNRAAHPSDRTLTDNDADAVLEFTREYFQHVYVLPAKMAKFNFDKPPK